MSLSTRSSSRLGRLLNLASIGLVIALAGFMGCSDAISEDDSTLTGATVTVGTYSDPVCNGGFRDGVCNALGGDPESCMCLDCAETAYCLGKCNDNGTCEAAERDEGDNQTCRDCFQGGTSAPSSSAAEGTAEATTVDASNASTDATDAASSDAATTDAPSSSAAGGGGGGGGV